MQRSSLVKRAITTSLAALLIIPAAQAAPAPQQPDTSSPQTQRTEAVPAQQSSAVPDAPSPQAVPQTAGQDTLSSSSEPQQNSPIAPVGTAAAPAETPVGTTGSRPAGAVIAPARQKRVHTILISVALVVGAGVAIGTVAALSHGSPSQPH
jgi:hypothetical protein